MIQNGLADHMNKPVSILNRPVTLGVSAFGILALLFTVLIYQRFLIIKEAQKKEAYDILNTAKDKLQEVLAYSSSATKVLTFFIDNNGTVQNFDSVAAGILITNKVIDALELAPGGVIRYVYPVRGNEVLIGYDILKDSSRNKEALKTIDKNDLFFSGPFELKQGGIGIVGRLPVFRNKKFWGFSAVVIRLPALLKAAAIDSVDRYGNHFQLSKINPDTKKEESFIHHKKEFSDDDLISVDVPNGGWKLSIRLVAGYRGLADVFILALLGFLISIFGGIFIFSLVGRPKKLNELVKERTMQLKESEEKFSRAFHSNVLGFAIYNEDFRIVDINEPYATVLESEREELIGKTSDEAGLISKINIEKRTAISNEIEVLLNIYGQISNFETEIETKNGEPVTVLLSIEQLELNNKQHWLTSIIDITDKKKAELLLKENEEKYRTLIEQASDGIVITDLDGYILEVNNSICAMSGYTEQEMLGEHLQKFLPAEDTAMNPLRINELMQGNSLLYERRLLKKDGDSLEIEVNSKMASTHTLIGFIRDITERKKNEETLRYQAYLLESVSDAITSLDMNRCIVSWNKACEELYGFIQDEVLGKKIPELVTFDFPSTTTDEVFKQVYSQGQWKGEFNFIHPKTKVKTHLLSSLSLLKKEEGDVTGLILTSKDITERKKADEEVRMSHERFELIAQATNDAVWDHDFQKNETWGNTKLFDLYGMEPGTMKVTFEMFLDKIHPDERHAVVQRLNKAIENRETSLSDEFRFKTADGEYKNFYDRAYIKYDKAGKPLRILGAMQDITERENAQKIILESEEKYRTLVEQATDGIFIADKDGRFLIVNSAGYVLSQYTPEEMKGMTIYDLVLPEDIKKDPFHFSEMMSNQVARSERRMKRKDGTLLDVEVTAKFISGNRFLAFVRDVSERKKAEKQLAENEQRLNRAELMGKLGHGFYNIKNGSMHLSEGLYKIFGVTPETFSHTIDGLRSVIHPDDFLIQQEAVETMFTKGEVEVEFRIVRPDGEVQNVLFKTRLTKNEKGELIDSFTTALCVTDRKKAQKELEESFSVLEATLESTADGILVVNLQGRVIRFNKKFAELWNIPRDILATGDDNKAINFVLNQLKTPEKFLSKIKELYAHPEAVSFDTLEFKDGRVFERYSQPQLINEQKLGRVWSFRDVTEKFKAKELLEKSYGEIRQLASNLQSIREDERTNIAREIHDELGQQLTGLKMDIHWLSRKIKSADKEINNKMKESIELINATITSVRKIATDLRPSILDDLGLMAALEWQGEEFEKRSGTKVKFINNAGDLEMRPEVATAIFRIYQELLTNIARHANARLVTALLNIEDQTLWFSIKDNGVGFNADTIDSKKTLGLLGIKERTLLMGGTYEIKTRPGEGSETIISVPLDLVKMPA